MEKLKNYNITVFSVENAMPEPQDMSEEGNDYYIVFFESYKPALAMYLEDADGNCAWYASYISKIVKPVTHWANYKNFINEPK